MSTWREILVGGMGAILASLCCIGPLIIVSLGVGGAWMGSLTVFEPYRPYAMGTTVFALGYAFYKLYLRPKECKIGEACGTPTSLKIQKKVFWVITVMILALLTLPWYVQIFY